MAGLSLRDVAKTYHGGRPVLVDVDLDVVPGEVVGVVGGNGSGKSTLLKIIVGVTPQTSGTVTGRPTQIGYVPERFPTHARISARSYLKHIGRIRGLGTRESKRRAAALLDRLALVGGSGTALRRLSKGNAQKVALAQALIVPPDLLVLDEPWSGLDAAAHEALAELIAEVAAQGGAVVFTDHRDAVVRANATTIYRIDDGVLTGSAMSGPVDEPGGAVVELIAGPGRPEEPDWGSLPGVVEVRRVDDVVVLDMDGAHSDELLFHGIRNGWSVVGVRRSLAVGVSPGPGEYA